MRESEGETRNRGLSVIVAEGGLRFVIDAAAVDKLEPLAAESVEQEKGGERDSPAGRVVSLSARLGIEPKDEHKVLISLRGREERIAVEAIESVLDLSDHRLISLPVLTRLREPIFVGVHDMGGDLVPVLDVGVVLAGG